MSLAEPEFKLPDSFQFELAHALLRKWALIWIERILKRLAIPPNTPVAEKGPLVSVIVPTFNRPGMLAKTLKSIEAQTYRPVEIIVVNDAGENVESVVSALNQEDNITYIRHKKNKGLAASRNTGIIMARGKYIAYLDDDDLFYPLHLETLLSFLEKSDYKVAYTDAYCAHQEKRGNEYFVTRREINFSYDFDYSRIFYQNYIPVPCFMHEKACLEVIGNFDETLKRHEDWDLWIRMSMQFKMAHIKKLTCEYTARNDGSSMTSGRANAFRTTCERIFQKYESKTRNRPEILKGQAFMRSVLRAKEALELARDGDVASGISLLAACLEFDPHNSQTHNFLGQLYMLNADRDNALYHLEIAVEIDPSNLNFRKVLRKAQAYFYSRKNTPFQIIK